MQTLLTKLQKNLKEVLGCNGMKAVIGLGFGDEGKGMFVDYLCSHNPDSIVIRFSGGHQAGHTVVKDGVRHIFSNFGSGTLRGNKTYWSKHCTVEPVSLFNEFDVLLNIGKYAKGIYPVIYIDDRCPVTTPFEILKNRSLEATNKHGSCGVGFGATIDREEKFYSLRFIDLYYPDILKAKMNVLKDYYNFDVDLEEFFYVCNSIPKFDNIKRILGAPFARDYIFEGSQGLLLDQHMGFFPNVTRADTGSKNLPDDIEYYLVTRAYQTRHGNGFMTNEYIPFFEIKANPNETNVTHEYQGKFRRTMLDVSLLEYAIRSDKKIALSDKKNLVITCLDHMKEWKFTYNGEIINCGTRNNFIKKIKNILNIEKVFISCNEESFDIESWDYE